MVQLGGPPGRSTWAVHLGGRWLLQRHGLDGLDGLGGGQRGDMHGDERPRSSSSSSSRALMLREGGPNQEPSQNPKRAEL